MFDIFFRETQGNRRLVVVELLSIRRRRTRRVDYIDRRAPEKCHTRVMRRSTKKLEHFIKYENVIYLIKQSSFLLQSPERRRLSPERRPVRCF